MVSLNFFSIFISILCCWVVIFFNFTGTLFCFFSAWKVLCDCSVSVSCFYWQKYNADYELSAKEGADTLAYIALLEEKLHPAMVRYSYCF